MIVKGTIREFMDMGIWEQICEFLYKDNPFPKLGDTGTQSNDAAILEVSLNCQWDNGKLAAIEITGVSDQG